MTRVFQLSLSFICTTYLFILIMLCTGCFTAALIPDGSQEDSFGGRGGGDGVIHLPFANTGAHQCVQGAGGSYSHTLTSTRYDIDFDTSNSVDEEIYAPVSGVARVHMESATTNFGYHVNIEQGDGNYVVLAHFSEIFVQDGEEITAGQLLGYDGCTGNCTGDHVHVGRHQGDATQPAEYGTSVGLWYYTADVTAGTGFTTYASDELICGIRSEGDAQDGHFYSSALSVPLWHPNGTLVKTPSTAKVYLIDNGEARWIETQDVFWSLGYDFNELVTISDEELQCLGEGEVIDEDGFVDAVKDPSGNIWLIFGTASDSERFRVRVRETAWEEVLVSWGLSYSLQDPPTSASSSSSYLTSWPEASGYARFREGTLVTEASTSDVYFISEGVAVPVLDWETYLILGFFHRTLLVVDDGAVATIQDNVGSCRAGVWCLDQEAVTSCGGGLDLGSGGEYGGTVDDEDVEEDDEDVEEDDEDVEEDDEDVEEDDEDVEEDDEDVEEDDEDVEEDDEDVEEDDEDVEEDDEDVEEEDPEYDDEETSEPEDTAFEYDDSNPCDGEDACLEDMDGDGTSETLMMVDDAWLTSSIDGEPAYVYANIAGCFDGSLDAVDLYEPDPSIGYYLIDFSDFIHTCTAEITLISSIGTNGHDPDAVMGNWYWWQNASFCSYGSTLCELKDNGTSWEEWMLRVDWNPSSGLSADGNGYTSNDQL